MGIVASKDGVPTLNASDFREHLFNQGLSMKNDESLNGLAYDNSVDRTDRDFAFRGVTA